MQICKAGIFPKNALANVIELGGKRVSGLHGLETSIQPWFVDFGLIFDGDHDSLFQSCRGRHRHCWRWRKPCSGQGFPSDPCLCALPGLGWRSRKLSLTLSMLLRPSLSGVRPALRIYPVASVFADAWADASHVMVCTGTGASVIPIPGMACGDHAAEPFKSRRYWPRLQRRVNGLIGLFPHGNAESCHHLQGLRNNIWEPLIAP